MKIKVLFVFILFWKIRPGSRNLVTRYRSAIDFQTIILSFEDKHRTVGTLSYIAVEGLVKYCILTNVLVEKSWLMSPSASTECLSRCKILLPLTGTIASNGLRSICPHRPMQMVYPHTDKEGSRCRTRVNSAVKFTDFFLEMSYFC